MELHELNISSVRQLLLDREITSFDLTQALLQRIEKFDEKIGAFITVDKEKALEQAKKADRDIADNHISVLTGIPIALKDILCTKGIKTTCGSQILDNFIPRYDGTVVSILKENGAVIIGKTNLDEFAMGSSTENSSYHITRNPWNKDHSKD